MMIFLPRESILANEAVWFGCEVLKRYVAKQGFLDQKVSRQTRKKRDCPSFWCCTLPARVLGTE
jgi:hypothetical protein